MSNKNTTNTSTTTNVTIGPVRLTYARLFEPASIDEGSQKKYSTGVLIAKSDKNNLAKLNAAIEAAKIAGKDSKFGGKTNNLKLPLRDGDVDKEDDEAYANHMFFNCSSLQRPGVVDINRNPIINAEDVYSGCYGYINVTLYPFNNAGNKGVAVGLNHFMKTKDGEALSGGVSVDTAFDGIEIDSDGYLL